jgi:hypothetical protein
MSEKKANDFNDARSFTHTSTHLLTPFSMTSNTKLEASCRNVLLEMLDMRLRPDMPDISETDERRDPERPNLESVPVGDFKAEFFICGTESPLVGLSTPVFRSEWW